MRLFLRAALLVVVLLCWMMPAAWANVDILCYHEVDKKNDAFSVDSGKLEAHIVYLKNSGYRFISPEEYLAYTKGELRLPGKSVMLTFDDGYRSFYTKVYPLLQKYRVPALLSIVTSWDADTKPSDVGALVNWDEVKEMESSGLVTLGSHSHALHKMRQVNPQGEVASVARNRLYFNGRYETEEEYRLRLDRDFKTTQAIFTEKLGHPVKFFVWPYGDQSGTSTELALANGFEALFLLAGNENPPGETSRVFADRGLIYGNPGVDALKKLLQAKGDAWNGGPLRMAQVDIDSLYDADALRMKQNIEELKVRLDANGVKVVALQAFADPDGDGNVDEVYFQNREVPVRADVFNYIDNNLRQSGLRVIAWMPTLALTGLIREDGSNRITAATPDQSGWYGRATPFDPEVQARLTRVFEDLSNLTSADGVLFQDDLYMNDFEDVSVYGKAAYKRATGRELDLLDRDNAAEMKEWTDLKTTAINGLVAELAATFKKNRPGGTVMRNIYTAPVLEPEAKEWFAQDFAAYLEAYDYTIIMAYPYMDKAEDALAYLGEITDAVKAHPGAMDKVFIKLQSYDWAKEKWISQEDLSRQVRELEAQGAVNIGYYPDTGVALPPRSQAVKAK